MVAVGELRYVWQAGVKGNELCGCGLSRSTSARSGWRSARRRSAAGTRSTWTRCSRSKRRCCATAGSRCWPRRELVPGARPSGCDATPTSPAICTERSRRRRRSSGGRLDQEPAVRLLPARRSRAVDLRVVHLVRDSRGVVFSWMKKVVRPEVTTGDEAYFQEFSPVSAGMRWMECNLAFELLRRLRTPTVRMRYEALAADPRERGRAMHSSSSSSRRPTTSPAARRRRGRGARPALVRGNPMRFAHGRQRVRVDDAWRTGMAQTRPGGSYGR